MKTSPAIREALLHFYNRLSASDAASFDDLVSSHPALTVIGTAPGEWITERDHLKYGFETDGFRIEPGEPRGYQAGTVGWLVDEPTFFFPDGLTMQARLTVVMHLEDDRWKLIHMHASIGVPNEDIVTPP